MAASGPLDAEARARPVSGERAAEEAAACPSEAMLVAAGGHEAGPRASAGPGSVWFARCPRLLRAEADRRPGACLAPSSTRRRVPSRGRGASSGPRAGGDSGLPGRPASSPGPQEREAEAGVPETGGPGAAGGEDGAAGQARAGAGLPGPGGPALPAPGL